MTARNAGLSVCSEKGPRTWRSYLLLPTSVDLDLDPDLGLRSGLGWIWDAGWDGIGDNIGLVCLVCVVRFRRSNDGIASDSNEMRL